MADDKAKFAGAAKALKVPIAPGENKADLLAKLLLRPEVHAATLISSMEKGADINALVPALVNQVEAVTDGDMKSVEAMLVSQAYTLNEMFTTLSTRAYLNFGQYMDAGERYLRLAMKAQSQCRSTVETLAEMKNPRPVAFVKQANIAHGHQQVNNGSAREENEIRPNKLSETNDELHPNSGAPALESRTNSPLETLGKIDRPKVRRRKS